MSQNFRVNPNSKDLDLSTEEGRLTAEVGAAIIATKEQPKDIAFDFFLGNLSDAMLMRMMDAVSQRHSPEDDHPAIAPIILASVFLRSHLYGDKRGGFSATESELYDITQNFSPYFILEFVRRRQCFGGFYMPESPWVFNAAIRVIEPNRLNIQRTIAELEKLNMPYPPLLTDEETLRQMETEGIGVEMPMPVEGRAVISEETIETDARKLPPVDAQKFERAFREVNEVAFAPEPMESVDMPDVDVIRKSGAVRQLSGADTPQLRAIKVFNKHFHDDREKAQSATVRFFALTDLLRKNALNDWVKSEENGLFIPPAILVAVSTVELTKGGSFPMKKFLRKVESLTSKGK